jgi:hypothetical protein
MHPKAAHDLPSFVTPPGETDVLMVVTAIVLLLAVVGFGILFLKLHALPEHVAHKKDRVQMEIVSVLCLIALFTHMHIFWIAGLILAFIEIPDFAGPLRRIAGSVGRMAGDPTDSAAETRSAHGTEHPHHDAPVKHDDGTAASTKPAAVAATKKEVRHA